VEYFDKALAFLHQYPEVIAILLGTLASWAIATLLEALFIPETWSNRKTKQFTVLVSIALATVVSYIVWRAMDPADPRIFNFAVSLTCALISPFSYVWVAKALTHFFPWIGSVWYIGSKPEAQCKPSA
jgi:hypothetical protein